MRPDLEKISELNSGAFVSKRVKRKNRPLLSSAWHYHPEIEICFTKRSEGKRYVGNNIAEYTEGDLVMFGPNLPHGFTTTEKSNQVVIQFESSFLGDKVQQLSEFKEIRSLFIRASMGLEFYGDTKDAAQSSIKKILNTTGMEKLIHLLRLLSDLADSAEYKLICTKDYSANLNMGQLSRMKTLFRYIESNFQKEITISEAAALTNLTESAFYKFIKRHTNKKFTQILNEYRINYASMRLINTEMTISEICFDSGFKNKSYFNRKFKEVLDLSPREFRAQYT